MRKKVDALEKENAELKKQLVAVQKTIKRNNIIIFGIGEKNKKPLLENVTEILKNKLQIELSSSDFSNIYRIGQEAPNKIRPIFVELTSQLKKHEILGNVSKLKGSGVSISKDLIPSEREEQKIIYKNYKKAKELNYSTKIIKNTLMVNDVTYSIEELKEADIFEGVLLPSTSKDAVEASDEETKKTLRNKGKLMTGERPTTRQNRK